MMKKIYQVALAALTLSVLTATKAAADDMTLVVSLEDGSSVTCSFAKKPQMTFADNTLTLTTADGVAGSWEFTAVDSWSFSANDPSGIESTKAGTAIAIRDGRITVSGTQSVTVYNLAGKAVKTSTLSNGNEQVVTVDNLPAGVYVLQVGKQSVKFSVK